LSVWGGREEFLFRWPWHPSPAAQCHFPLLNLLGCMFSISKTTS
jgi:hypothetical protein